MLYMYWNVEGIGVEKNDKGVFEYKIIIPKRQNIYKEAPATGFKE